MPRPHPVLRLALCMLAGCAALVPANAPARAGHPAPAIGVVSLGLERQVRALVRPRRRGFHPEQAPPMVRLEVTSSRNVAAVVRRLGGRIRADLPGAVLSADLPANRVHALARQTGVLGLFPARRLRPEGDQSVGDIRANQVWSIADHGGIPIQGSHVLVGIVDGGSDYHSADFKNPDGSSRIRFIWDQTRNGHAPAGFSYGYECDAASIGNGRCPERDDTDGHGTHVLGIAAGNGRTSTPAREMGVAPRADIIIVKSDLSTDNVIAAWKYLVDKARSLHEPIVINNSFGDQDGPHDGSEPEARAIDRLAGGGRIFVKSAGNAGHQGAHAVGTVRQNGASFLQFGPTGYSDAFDLDVFYPSGSSLDLSLRNARTGETFGPIPDNARIVGKHSKDGDTRVTIESGRYTSTFREVYIAVRSASHLRLHGSYQLAIRGRRVAGDARYEAWMQGQDDARFKHGDDRDTMSIPADAHKVITVSNYATTTSWTDMHNEVHQVCDNYVCRHGVLNVGDIAASSSRGPTADGRQKPDIAAPGTVITSTLTHDAPVCANGESDNCVDPTLISPDGKHVTYTGTSMAAPHVTGTIALMLQVDPSLGPAAVDAVLRESARRDTFTGSGPWGPAFGAGKLDALAAVQRVLTAKARRTARARRARSRT